jgi:vacuolar-type H+-ATPase subunit C/Vma6
MSDWVDRQTARLLVGERIDAANLLLVIRSKTLGISAEEIQSAVVPVNYRLGETLHAAAAAGSALNALRAFVKTAYSDCVEGFLESYKDGNSLQHLDLALRRRHASTCLTLFAGFPFSAGLPIAFAYLMGYEMTDLQAIVSGKHDRVPRERIEQLLVL